MCEKALGRHGGRTGVWESVRTKEEVCERGSPRRDARACVRAARGFPDGSRFR